MSDVSVVPLNNSVNTRGVGGGKIGYKKIDTAEEERVIKVAAVGFWI